MLLLTGCDHLEEIRYIDSLVQLEVLNASGCTSLKRISSGSFDSMVLLKILDLSATSITFLPSITACRELYRLDLQCCPLFGSQHSESRFIQIPYGVSKSGMVQNLQLGSIEDMAYWMSMRWLPCGLTFILSDRFGIKKFQIVISPLVDDQTMKTEAGAINTDLIFRNSHFRTKHFTDSTVDMRYLGINGSAGIPSDLDGILYHAQLISLKRLAMTTRLSDLKIRSMKAVRELWVEDCDQLEIFLSIDDVQALSTVGSLQNLWISNIEKLSSFCNGVEDAISFNCLKHLLLDCCPNIMYLFPSKLRLSNLETLHIRFCDILETLFDSSVLGEHSLPRLQFLQLWALPELTSVCGGVLPFLKNLKRLVNLALPPPCRWICLPGLVLRRELRKGAAKIFLNWFILGPTRSRRIELLSSNSGQEVGARRGRILSLTSSGFVGLVIVHCSSSLVVASAF
ncbi:hypothetical protein PR202_ga09363 [Eleusine coracana subsp. coracana]|uniref:Disease resistance protein At4g27190-like leucine-rich repeats domain-containing protein n=1 Tax=Eleusine coracana subsp. coracana TaxID=191504 RepID=A0AAV5C3R9_ELECO|nr:hypothetical protein PR202_ga09363 [Eleusine coracana subsp. coracana]